MGTPYTELYNSVLSKIKDYTFADMTEFEVYDILSDYIRPAIVAFRICKVDLTDRDDRQFNNDLNYTEIEILANFMVVEYLDANYLRVPLALKQQLSSKDFNAFSPANHLKEIHSLRDKYLADNETLLARYSWIKRTY